VNNDWVLTYVDRNRAELIKNYPTIDKFMSGYQVPESGIHDMIHLLEEKEVPFNEEEFKRSERAIKLRTKALIARNLYDNEAFYVAINDLNPALKKAVEVLQDGTFDSMNLAHSNGSSKPKADDSKKRSSKKKK
jgi:carboxyl-terminal processing protease